MSSEGGQVLGVSDAGAGDLGELGEEICLRSWELIATDEPPMIAKPLLDTIVVENGEGDGCLADSTCTNESHRVQVFGKINDPVDQLIASETGPRHRGR